MSSSISSFVNCKDYANERKTMNKKPKRRKTKQVRVGDTAIGGNAPVSVQSMLNVQTADTEAALDQIQKLRAAGCDLIRLAIRDQADIQAFKTIRSQTAVPLVADIHFDYRLAIQAADSGADKLRINPGNIGSDSRVKEVASSATANGIPIRIGVNAGSLPKNLDQELPVPSRMLLAAEREISILEKAGFGDIVVSLKSHDVLDVIESNRLFAEEFDYPLHLGVTEAGLAPEALIKGSAGIGSLLLDGIGDTIRFSITGDPLEEVLAGKSLLRACNLADSGIELVSCPVCGRCRVDLETIAREVRSKLPVTSQKLVVAVMGCEVNGPGEAESADIGIAGGKEDFLLFKHGKPAGKIPQKDAVKILLAEIACLLEKRKT